MKNIYILILGMAAVFGLSACQDETEYLPSQYPVEVTDSTIIDDDCLVVEILENNASTRAAYSGFSSTLETGDEIGIYAWNGTTVISSNVKFTRQSDGSWTPASKVPYNASYTYCAYFPYRSDHSYTPATSGTVDARFSTFIADASNKFWTTDQSTKAKFTSANLCIGQGTHVGSGNRVTFSLGHKRGLAVFTGDAAEMTFTGNIPYLISDSKYFLMKPSTTTEFTDEEETYSLSAEAGKYVLHNVILPIDLSMVDNAGTKRAAGTRTTANCYLVHRAGKYKLPLVYGNAIKNGAPNTVAFNPGGSASSTYTTQFVNHAGTGISGPWITKSTSGTGVNKGMGLTATSAELLWQDRSGLITSVSVNGDYLEFTVGSFGGGNALIAVKNGSTILWSWHIWATTETLASTTAVNTGTGGHTYNVAAVNLGWVPTGGSGKQGYCPYYQWGRKDPFIPCNGTTNGNTNKTIYNISGANITPASITASSTGIQYESSTSATLATNIQNPIKHYYNSSNYGPCNTTYYNMWDAQNTATNNVTSATKKTIYDPCPPGFCVPTGNLWYYFGGNANPTSSNSRSDSNWDSTNKGKTWTLNGASIYFPAAGYRNFSSGALSIVGSCGYYWSATPYSPVYGRYLYFDSSYWYWNSNFRASGVSVRPVAEE